MSGIGGFLGPILGPIAELVLCVVVPIAAPKRASSRYEGLPACKVPRAVYGGRSAEQIVKSTPWWV